MREIFLIVIAALLFTGCSNCGGKKVSDVAEESAIVEEITNPDPAHYAQNSLDYEGSYKGTVVTAKHPEGFSLVVVLKESTYSKSVTLGEETIESDGAYEWREDGTHIELLDTEEPNLFFVAENRLILVDAELNKLKDSEENLFELEKFDGEL